MPTGLPAFNLAGLDLSYEGLFFSCREAKALCNSLGELIPIDGKQYQAARIFRMRGFCGTLGFISPLSEPFCASCNKLRLTSEGRLRHCLHSSKAVNLKEALESGISEEGLAFLIEEAVALKPKSHNLSRYLTKKQDSREASSDSESENFSMCQIGG